MIRLLLISFFCFGLLQGHDPLVFEKNEMQMILPECPLAPDAVQVSNHQPFTAWTKVDQNNSFELIHKITQIWYGQGTSDYLIYGKEEGSKPFQWEVVPFPPDGWSFWNQFRVLWNTAFGAPCLTDSEREARAAKWQSRDVKPIPKHNPEGDDPFQNPEVIQSQMVYEGKEIYVLYNYAPVEKLHFLIIPKERRETFSDLTASEYLEAMQATQRLIHHYLDDTAYLFHKNGKGAGQTVSHWHLHVIFTKTQSDEWLGRLIILKNMLFGASPLPKEELRERVAALKGELSHSFALPI